MVTVFVCNTVDVRRFVCLGITDKPGCKGCFSMSMSTASLEAHRVALNEVGFTQKGLAQRAAWWRDNPTQSWPEYPDKLRGAEADYFDRCLDAYKFSQQ
jgi:hypothetical protein